MASVTLIPDAEYLTGSGQLTTNFLTDSGGSSGFNSVLDDEPSTSDTDYAYANAAIGNLQSLRLSGLQLPQIAALTSITFRLRVKDHSGSFNCSIRVDSGNASQGGPSIGATVGLKSSCTVNSDGEFSFSAGSLNIPTDPTKPYIWLSITNWAGSGSSIVNKLEWVAVDVVYTPADKTAADTGLGSESAGAVTIAAAADAGSGSESTSLTYSILAAETGIGFDDANVTDDTGSHPMSTDLGFGSESVDVTYAQTAADHGIGSETTAVFVQVDWAWSDEATGTECADATADSGDIGDSASGDDATIIIGILGEDMASSDELIDSLTGEIQVAENGTGLDVAILAFDLTDSGLGAEDFSIVAIAPAASDAGVGDDTPASGGDALTSDAGSGIESWAGEAFEVSDEGGELNVPNSGFDPLRIAEIATAGADVPGNDSGVGDDEPASIAEILGEDSGAADDAPIADAAIDTADSSVGDETGESDGEIGALEAGLGAEMPFPADELATFRFSDDAAAGDEFAEICTIGETIAITADFSADDAGSGIDVADAPFAAQAAEDGSGNDIAVSGESVAAQADETAAGDDLAIQDVTIDFAAISGDLGYGDDFASLVADEFGDDSAAGVDSSEQAEITVVSAVDQGVGTDSGRLDVVAADSYRVTLWSASLPVDLYALDGQVDLWNEAPDGLTVPVVFPDYLRFSMGWWTAV